MCDGQRSAERAASAVALLLGIAVAEVACRGPVTPRFQVAKVAVSPGSATVRVGTQMVLRAVVYDAAGHALDAQPVAWTSQNASIASVSADGVVTGNARGQTLIAAGAQGQSGIAQIDVTVPPPPPSPPPKPPRPPDPPPPPKHTDGHPHDGDD